MKKINNLISEMINFDAGEPKLIQHFIKVYEFAKLIGNMENISSDKMKNLEVAAIVHDIGIKVCIEKYGKYNGKLQEDEGSVYAEELLKRIGFNQELIDRVIYLVAHHHTYSNIDGIDYQILVEADFLVNLYEKQSDKDSIQNAYEKIFKTESGRKLCNQMFMIED
ncbi:HD domain-containing protein [Clostridium estertheticum]|uniref:HD domain-containing protein n=1 Tax=Clostridium estertheticum TaxID=238834 RepID=UPI001C7D1174|nr:HD domain-containing protein [Clostridium estertheticum]MBX4270049.1 HD domain-containing protein [Clostridium estertheticum]WLC80253.1 HD domain-containing protein [Clostridium estertheticum]